MEYHKGYVTHTVKIYAYAKKNDEDTPAVT